jgi:uncharacterized protein YqgC (DUF456 family)
MSPLDYLLFFYLLIVTFYTIVIPLIYRISKFFLPFILIGLQLVTSYCKVVLKAVILIGFFGISVEYLHSVQFIGFLFEPLYSITKNTTFIKASIAILQTVYSRIIG